MLFLRTTLARGGGNYSLRTITTFADDAVEEPVRFALPATDFSIAFIHRLPAPVPGIELELLLRAVVIDVVANLFFRTAVRHHSDHHFQPAFYCTSLSPGPPLLP